MDFDVFLSYQSRDQSSIRVVFEALKARRIRVWWDEDQIRPGSSFQQELSAAIRRCSTTCVFFGPGDQEAGRWQRPELELAYQLTREGTHRVIPVLLPGLDPGTKLPEFLPTLSCVAFKDTLDEKTLDKLEWAITGKQPDHRPTPPGIPPPGIVDESETALGDIAKWLQITKGTVTFIIGSNISSTPTDSPPRSCDITLQLLQDLRIAGLENLSLLPPVDVAASYYAIREGDPQLEDRFGVLLDSRPALSSVHEQLCAFLKGRTAQPSRGRRQQKQLIIYTNFDLNMERALLRNRIPFTRVVQNRSSKMLVLNRYSGIQFEGSHIIAGGRRIDMTDAQDLDGFIYSYGAEEIAVDGFRDDLVEPILYKLRGSQDIPDSCVISAAQLFAYASTLFAGGGVPEFVTAILKSTYVVFLGFGFLDPDFRLTYYTLVQRACTDPSYKKYLIQLAPENETNDCFRRMEAGAWSKVKDAVGQQNIKTVEESGARFLERLIGKLQ